jgi:hypothetical protein
VGIPPLALNARKPFGTPASDACKPLNHLATRRSVSQRAQRMIPSASTQKLKVAAPTSIAGSLNWRA